MAFIDELNNVKRKSQEFDHLAIAQKLYNQTLEYTISNIKAEIKKQVLKENKGAEGVYTGNIPLGISIECPGRSKISCIDIEAANYSWYHITDRIRADYGPDYHELRLQNICEEKVGFMSMLVELTDFGSRFIADLVSLCRKDGIKIECYLKATGRDINDFGKTKEVVYERVNFGERLNPKCKLQWGLRATYIVR